MIGKCLGTTHRLGLGDPLLHVSRGESWAWKYTLMSAFFPKHVLPLIRKRQLKYNMYGNKEKGQRSLGVCLKLFILLKSIFYYL